MGRPKGSKNSNPKPNAASMAGLGHNSERAGTLKALIERVERLNEERAMIAGDIKEIFAEAKGTGFDLPTMRKVIGLRRQDVEKRKAAQDMLDVYMHALGMLADTPLGQAAVSRLHAAE